MTRRIKICTESPLPPVKAWFPLKPSIDTIYQLKYGLTHDLTALVDNNFKRGDIELQIEGFDLLDGSSVEILDLERDILTIKLKPESSAVGSKRSGDDLDPRRNKKRKIGVIDTANQDVVSVRPGSTGASSNKRPKKTGLPKRIGLPANASLHRESRQHAQRPIAVAMSEPKSPADSSDTSSSSESSASSTSESESSSSSESSASDTPSVGPVVRTDKTTRPLGPQQSGRTLGNLLLKKQAPASMTSSAPSTPPGQGKKSTRDRNQRRRANRKSAKVTESVALLPPQATSRSILATNHVTSSSPASTPVAIAVPRAMANKNKRKGFRQAMDGVTGTKTIYSDGPEDNDMTRDPDLTNEVRPQSLQAELAPAPLTQDFPVDSTRASRPTYASDNTVRLPPLPPSRMTSLASNIIVTSQWFQTPSRQEDMKQLRRESKRLSHDTLAEKATPLVNPLSQTIPSAVWETLALSHKKFDTIDESGFKALSIGNILAWEDLELNESTWQPEVRLCLGRVQTVGDHSIDVQLLKRPVEASEEDQISEETDAKSTSDEPGESTIIALTDQEVCRGKYRVIQ